MQGTGISVPHNPALIIILLVTVLTAACGDLSVEQQKQIDEALSDSLTSTTESWDVDMEIIEDGLRKVRLQGSYAATYVTDEENETRIKGPVYIQVYDSLNNVKTRVRSDRAVYRGDDAEFEFFGDVNVDTDNNRHLESEYLKWNQNNDLITTPEFVIITTPTDSLAGTGFESTTDLVDYTIREPKGRVIYD